MTNIEAMKLALDALEDALNSPMWNRKYMEAAIAALRQAISNADKPTCRFVPFGIVNEHHEIDWIEGVTDDQAPVGSVLYGKEML